MSDPFTPSQRELELQAEIRHNDRTNLSWFARETLALLYLDLGKAQWERVHPSFHPNPTAEDFGLPIESWSKVLELLDGYDHYARTEAYHRLAEIFVYAGRFEQSMEFVQQALESQESLAAKHALTARGIRFFQTRTATLSNLGQLMNEVEYYVKTGILGLRPPMRGVLLAWNGKVANPTAMDYVRQHVCVVTNGYLVERLQRLSKDLEWNTFFFTMPDGRVEWQWSGMIAIQKLWEQRGLPHLLRLRENDRNRGRAVLKEMGVPDSAWYVTLHVREPAHEVTNSGTGIRNGKIVSYVSAIREVTSKGGWVIRMGDPGMTKLPAMEGVIDYAHSSHKSDWMDVFLCATSRFFIGTASGLCSLPMVFGVPIVMTNVMPSNSFPVSAKDIYIPKLYRNCSTGELVSFARALTPPLRNCYNHTVLKPLDIEVIDNTEEELADVTREMLQRMSGIPPYSAADEALQKQFQEVVSEFDIDGMQARIGSAFLKKYERLLRGGDSAESTSPRTSSEYSHQPGKPIEISIE